jgi:soluble lytic murein transglycosylase-like protein
MKSWSAFLLALFCSAQIHAACFDQAASRYHVPVELLKAISTVESNGNPAAKNVNQNGSVDYGHMQINDWWLPKLEPYGITKASLLDPCVNTYVGAWILAQSIAKHGLTWNAIGAYNARSEVKRLIYARKVERVLVKNKNIQVASN